MKANQCFHGMTERNLTSWNTLIVGYEKFNPIEALYIFLVMDNEGFDPNCFIFTSAMAACANLTILSCRQQVHGAIISKGLERNMTLANALVDMHGQCGSSFHRSFKFFPKTKKKKNKSKKNSVSTFILLFHFLPLNIFSPLEQLRVREKKITKSQRSN